MYEWVHKRKFTQDDFTTTYPAHRYLAIDYDVAIKIANGAKHIR